MKAGYDSSGHDIVHSMIVKYIHALREIHPDRDASTSAQAHGKKVAAGAGMKRAFGEAFEVAIATVRIARYGDLLDSVTVPFGYEIEATLFPALEQAYYDTKNEETGAWDSSLFWEAVKPDLDNYIFSDDLQQLHFKKRRQAILAGTIQPEPSDRSWMEEEANNLEKRAFDIRNGLPSS